MDNFYFGLLYFRDYDPRFRFWCAVRYTFYRICAHILVWQDAWASPSKFDIETCLQYSAQFWLTVEPVVAWKADLPCWISWVQWLLFSQMKFLNNNRYIEVRINRTIWLWLIFFLFVKTQRDLFQLDFAVCLLFSRENLKTRVPKTNKIQNISWNCWIFNLTVIIEF